MKKEDKGQLDIFNNDNQVRDWWVEYWEDMPDFSHQKIDDDCFKIIIRIKSEAGLKRFSELIDQVITDKTQSIWFPKLEFRKTKTKRYKNES